MTPELGRDAADEPLLALARLQHLPGFFLLKGGAGGLRVCAPRATTRAVKEESLLQACASRALHTESPPRIVAKLHHDHYYFYPCCCYFLDTYYI